MLFSSSPSHTVNGSPRSRWSTIEATKYPNPGSWARGVDRSRPVRAVDARHASHRSPTIQGNDLRRRLEEAVEVDRVGWRRLGRPRPGCRRTPSRSTPDRTRYRRRQRRRRRRGSLRHMPPTPAARSACMRCQSLRIAQWTTASAPEPATCECTAARSVMSTRSSMTVSPCRSTSTLAMFDPTNPDAPVTITLISGDRRCRPPSDARPRWYSPAAGK